MAQDFFLKVEGAPGESTDSEHRDWIEVQSFGFGANQPAQATASTAGGATSKRVSVQDISFTKFADKAGPKLFEMCCTGRHVPLVTLELFRATGDTRVKYLEYKLHSAIVSSYQIGGSEGGTTESFSLNFAKIEITYVQQKRTDGTPGGKVSSGWDLAANRKV